MQSRLPEVRLAELAVPGLARGWVQWSRETDDRTRSAESNSLERTFWLSRSGVRFRPVFVAHQMAARRGKKDTAFTEVTTNWAALSIETRAVFRDRQDHARGVQCHDADKDYQRNPSAKRLPH